jgi:hypothetical protein
VTHLTTSRSHAPLEIYELSCCECAAAGITPTWRLFAWRRTFTTNVHDADKINGA